MADLSDLAHVCQLRYQDRRNRCALEVDVQKFYRQYDNVTTEFHRAIAELPISLCINAAHDRMYENALIENKKKPITEHYNFRNTRQFSLAPTSVENPIVFSLYGQVDDGESLVLTETDNLNFLVAVTEGEPPLSKFIASRFAASGMSFLFVGFGFEQWSTRILLHVLKAYGHEQSSIAIETDQFFSHPDHEKTAVYFAKQHFLKFRHVSMEQFASRLRTEFKKHKTQRSSSRRVVIPLDAPKAFLCHCSDDKEEVAKIGTQLHELGIETWRDEQNLRGGDKRDFQIEKVLKKHVDYVLVIQTPNMRKRVESYFYKEIEIARDREKSFLEEFVSSFRVH